LVQQLKTRAGRYAFELEFMVRASWVGTPIVAVPVKCTYSATQIGQSHFRPVRDLAHITFMNIGLVWQSWFVPRSLLVPWCYGQKFSTRRTVREFFSEHAHSPGPMSLAVGLGLFVGIVPIFGFQMMIAAALAHRWRLNKAITLLASNITIAPFAPFIYCGAMMLGHWLFTGEVMEITPSHMTWAHAREYIWQWLAGCLALAALAAATGTLITYLAARLWRWRRPASASEPAPLL
jgi:uncharacterized protein (DUF2062 family)